MPSRPHIRTISRNFQNRVCLILSGLAASVVDGVVRLALVRVTSENLEVGQSEWLPQHQCWLHGEYPAVHSASRDHTSARRFGCPVSPGPVCASQIVG